MGITQRLVLETEGMHGADVRGWNGEAARQEALEYEREMERACREEMERHEHDQEMRRDAFGERC